MPESHLLEFYGTECVHCRDVEPLLERLKEEEGIEVTRLEVWHNAENYRTYEKCDQGRCGGVPFLFNTETGKWICGVPSYEKLKEWAKGK